MSKAGTFSALIFSGLLAACAPTSPAPFPSEIERMDFDKQALVKMVEDTWTYQTADHIPNNIPSVGGAFDWHEQKNADDLNAGVEGQRYLIPGRMLHAVVDCTAKAKVVVGARPQYSCLDHTTALIGRDWLISRKTGKLYPDPETDDLMLFVPRQGAPDVVKPLLGEPSIKCPARPEPNKPANMLGCYWRPTTMRANLEAYSWEYGEPIPDLLNQLAGPKVARNFTRPFPTASDRAYEDIFVQIFQLEKRNPRVSTERVVMPGRLTTAIKACDDAANWTGQAIAGGIELETYLLVVEERMATDFFKPEDREGVPVMPLVLVFLTSQPMPISGLPPDQRWQLEANGIETYLPRQTQHGCLIDPRNDTALVVFENEEEIFYMFKQLDDK